MITKISGFVKWIIDKKIDSDALFMNLIAIQQHKYRDGKTHERSILLKAAKAYIKFREEEQVKTKNINN